MAERDGNWSDIWSRDGQPFEELPDPFAPEPPPIPPQEPPKRRRRWPLVLYTAAAIFLVTLVWLVLTAPLSRALEPLCMLWCLPGVLHNEWRHAFKMLTK